MRVGIIGWKNNGLLSTQLKKLSLPELVIVDFEQNPSELEDLDTVIFCDVDLSRAEGDKNSFLDGLRDTLSQNAKLLLVNLQDEWVAEITKEVMKKSPVTVLDYNRNHFGDAQNEEKAVYLVGLANGLSIDEIKERLSDE